jgi:hypothetical protein
MQYSAKESGAHLSYGLSLQQRTSTRCLPHYSPVNGNPQATIQHIVQYFASDCSEQQKPVFSFFIDWMMSGKQPVYPKEV